MSKTIPTIKKIAVAGAGGIGSHLTAMLYDFGVNRNQFDFASMTIDVFDDDTVDTKNLLHQNFCDDDLNVMKVESLKTRYAISPKPRFMVKDDFANYDLIFCCVDSMTFRKELYEYSWTNPKLIWIDGRCESKTGAVFNSFISKEKLTPNIDDNKDRAGCLLAYEKENNISHSTPIIVAATMLQTFLNISRGSTVLPEKKFTL